jgi:hypothetical protein
MSAGKPTAAKLLATLFLIVLPAVASAAERALTVYGGYRDGGSFTDVETSRDVDLEGSGAVSLALDFGLDKSRQYQIFFSHQRTELSLRDAPAANRDAVDMSVSYLHVGGTNFWEGSVGKGPYVVGGLGATFYDPSSGFDSELRPSLNLGIGLEHPLGKSLALRFEARGYATWVNSRGGFFCSGGCVISISGDVVVQGEFMLGVSARF